MWDGKKIKFPITYVQGLLSVFEFEKQMIMILTDDEIRIAAQSWAGLTDAPNPNATSFAAGAKYVLQKLQQTQCTTQLEFEKQMFSSTTLSDRLRKYLETVKAEDLIEEFEKLGYEFVPIDNPPIA